MIEFPQFIITTLILRITGTSSVKCETEIGFPSSSNLIFTIRRVKAYIDVSAREQIAYCDIDKHHNNGS